MDIQYDYYFWLALGYLFGGFATCAALVWAGFKWKRVGKVAFVLLILLGGTFDLMQCSNTIAHSLRASTQSKGERA